MQCSLSDLVHTRLLTLASMINLILIYSVMDGTGNCLVPSFKLFNMDADKCQLRRTCRGSLYKILRLTLSGLTSIFFMHNIFWAFSTQTGSSANVAGSIHLAAAAQNRSELFMDRLDRLLPESDNNTLLTLEDIAVIEEELLHFNIPTNVTVHFLGSEYVSIQFWRWLLSDQRGVFSDKRQQRCPRCHLHFPPWSHLNHLTANETADVILDMTCPKGPPPQHSKMNRNQTKPILVGGCGESQSGTGSVYANQGRKHYDYSAGFHVYDKSPFQTTYAHLHLSPNNKFNFSELWSVTDLARQLLQRPPSSRRNAGISNGTTSESYFDATFIHNDCSGRSGRGALLKAAIATKENASIARYGKCFHNIERPGWLAPYDGSPCAGRSKEYFFHDDCEATRDGTKTVLAGLHDFTFSLENTLSEDYFTEKRWEALIAGSVPIVWDNHNSEDSLPDPNAALFIKSGGGSSNEEKARELMKKLEYYRNNQTAYYYDFFHWKQKGSLTAKFTRKLFLSADYLICRLCEFASTSKG